MISPHTLQVVLQRDAGWEVGNIFVDLKIDEEYLSFILRKAHYGVNTTEG